MYFFHRLIFSYLYDIHRNYQMEALQHSCEIIGVEFRLS